MSDSRRIGFVAFDLDGTLIDSRRDIAVAANHALRLGGHPELAVDEIATYVGDGAKLLLARAARLPPNVPELGPLVAAFIDYYAAHATVYTQPMPGARAVLGALARDLPLALVTNKPRRTTDVVLADLDLAAYFSVVIAGGDLAQKKPDPSPLLHAAERVGQRASDGVIVGDGVQDIECGRRAGARTVAITGGFVDGERLASAAPDALIESLDELLPWIERWAQATSR